MVQCTVFELIHTEAGEPKYLPLECHGLCCQEHVPDVETDSMGFHGVDDLFHDSLPCSLDSQDLIIYKL